MTLKERQQFWIVQYLNEHLEASVVNRDFHDKFFATFGGKQKIYMWGACPVENAMKLLASMVKEGQLIRKRIGLHGLPGYPKWVYSYYLPDHLKENS